MTHNFWIKALVSLGALILITARLVWPELKIDTVTLGLLLVGLLPWLTSIIESAKFPGGWEVKFRDVQMAGQKVIEEHGTTTRSLAAHPSYLGFLEQDPNLALVGLRIEIEERLRALAKRYQIGEQSSLTRLYQELTKQDALNDSSVSGLQELIAAGNQAAHGARVENQITDWALSYGPQVLGALDSKLAD